MRKLFISVLLLLSVPCLAQTTADSVEVDTVSTEKAQLLTFPKAKKNYSYLKKCSVYAIKTECRNLFENYYDLYKNRLVPLMQDYGNLLLTTNIASNKLNDAFRIEEKRFKQWQNEHQAAYVIGTLYDYINHYNGKNKTQTLVNYALEFCHDIDIETQIVEKLCITGEALLEDENQ